MLQSDQDIQDITIGQQGKRQNCTCLCAAKKPEEREKKAEKPTTLIMGKFVIILALLVITAMQSFGIDASLSREQHISTVKVSPSDKCFCRNI